HGAYPVARRTVDGGADVRSARARIVDPRAQLPRRAVANVLLVAAGKLRDPVAGRVLMKAGDGGAHVNRGARFDRRGGARSARRCAGAPAPPTATASRRSVSADNRRTPAGPPRALS